MADKPILFSGPMIRALLDGRKTQTRRMVKPQPDYGVQPCYYSKTGYAHAAADGGCSCRPITCPYDAGGISADDYGYLWVRETWRVTRKHDRLAPCDIPPRQCTVAFAAGGSIANQDDGIWRPTDYECWGADWMGKTRTAIHMPRWASRLTLRITDVRVQRLQDISQEDAAAEGAGLYVPGHGFITEGELHADPGYSNYLAPRQGFEAIWTEINGADSWAANPWVWAISFETIHANIDTLK